jgi:hypothetical protein
MRSSAFLSLLFSGVFMAYGAAAQNSVWDAGKDTKKKAGKQVEKTTHKVKGFKDHLQHWGLYTNYRHGLLIGAQANSNGWSGCLYYQTRKGYGSSTIWELSFSEIKHEKQIKQQSADTAFRKLGKASSFIFGKINYLYTLQIGFNKEYLLLPAVLNGNLSISFRYGGGFTLAMLKPYYLQLIYQDTGSIPYLQTQKYDHADSAHFLNSKSILGTAKWGKGLNEITYVPGAYLHAAFVIEPAKNKSFIQAITLGAQGAFYAKNLAIMADQKAYPWQASLFAGLSLGKRWK